MTRSNQYVLKKWSKSKSEVCFIQVCFRNHKMVNPALWCPSEQSESLSITKEKPARPRKKIRIQDDDSLSHAGQIGEKLDKL